MVFLKLFLHLPVVLSSSPLKILEGFCCGIHSNRIHVIRNDLICFIEEGLFCLYNGSKTDKIRNYIFQRGQSSMVAIGPVRLCLVKIYIYGTNNCWFPLARKWPTWKWTWIWILYGKIEKKCPRYFRRDSRGNPRDLNMCRTGRSAALSRGRKSMPPQRECMKLVVQQRKFR